MSNLLLSIEDIIIGGRRPWIDNNLKADAVYSQIISAQSKLKHTFEAGSKVEFPAPITPMRTFYFNFIQSAAIYFLNTIIHLADNTTIQNEKLYYVNKIGLMPVVVLIEQLNSIIDNNKFSWESFQGPILGRDHEAKKRNAAYVAQLLKYYFLHMVYELHFQFPELLPDNSKSFEELNNRYFTEALHPGILTERQITSLIPDITLQPTHADISNFEITAKDDDDENEPVITFSKIIVNKEKFLSVERQIGGFNLINKHGEFIKDKGQRHNEKLAAILAIIFDKGYFHKDCFLQGKGKTKITRTDIGRVFEKRYTCRIEKQFRTFTGENKNPLNTFLALENTFFKSLKT